MRQPFLNARLQGFGTTIFAEMSALAVATGAVNLGQGFPDTDGPAEVRGGRGRGDPRRRQPVPARARRCPTLRAGDRRAPAALLRPRASTPTPRCWSPRAPPRRSPRRCSRCCEPGDEVIAFEPYYDSYAACIAMAGAVRRPVTLRPPAFALDLDALRAAVTPRTRLLLLNTPHNPTGTVFDRERAGRASARLAVEHDLLVVTDEVYEHLTFDGVEHVPDRHAARHARAHAHHLLGRQDVLGHRVEDRLGHGPAALVTRGAHGQAVPHLRAAGPFQPAIAVGLRAARQLLRRARRRPRGASATCCAPACARPASTCTSRRAPTSSSTDIRPLGDDDGAGLLPGAAGAVRRRRHPVLGLLRRPGRPAAAWCASRSASATRCSTRRWPG